MEIIVKNLKSYEDITLNLPMNTDLLKEKLGMAEYVIVSAEGLPVNEYESIIDINEFLNEYSDKLEDIKILGQLLTYPELKEIMDKEDYQIINFDEETDNWMFSDFNNENDLGLCLFEAGVVTLPFPYTQEMQSYIDWSYLWKSAPDWSKLTIHENTTKHYLVFIRI